jgi:hypothetical protein
MISLKASLKRLLGRIDKVKLVREIIVLAMVAYVGWLWNFVTDLKSLSLTTNFDYLAQNTPFYFVIISPFVILIIAILFVRKIDNWEDKKSNDRHSEIVKKFDELITEIRKEREGRK